MEKIAAGEDLTLLPLDKVLEMLVRETYARYHTSPDWKFPPSRFSYKGDTAGLLKHLIQIAWQDWKNHRYTLYDMSSYRTDVIQDRVEFLEKVMEYEDVDFATISSAVNAVHAFIKKARYETEDGYNRRVFAWTLTTFVNLDGYDLLDAYNVMMQEAKNNWLETFDTWVGSKYHIYSGISRVDYPVSGYTAFNERYDGRFTVSIPYRVEFPGNFKDWSACFHPQGVKRYIYKNSVKEQRDDSLGDCIECGIGSLAERTQGVIPLNEEWEEEGKPGVKLHGSEVLLPEYEDGLGGNILSFAYKRDRAKEIIANGGTVPGYAG